MSQNGAYVLGATVLTLGTLGASVFPTVLTPPPGTISMRLKLLGASGSTVQILPNYIPNATVGGATAAIGGYPLTANTDFHPVMGPARYYIAATGATATVAVLFELTPGATLV